MSEVAETMAAAVQATWQACIIRPFISPPHRCSQSYHVIPSTPAWPQKELVINATCINGVEESYYADLAPPSRCPLWSWFSDFTVESLTVESLPEWKYPFSEADLLALLHQSGTVSSLMVVNLQGLAVFG